MIDWFGSMARGWRHRISGLRLRRRAWRSTAPLHLKLTFFERNAQIVPKFSTTWNSDPIVPDSSITLNSREREREREREIEWVKWGRAHKREIVSDYIITSKWGLQRKERERERLWVREILRGELISANFPYVILRGGHYNMN